MTRRSDMALVNRILAGDRAAAADMVREHHAPVYRWLVRLAHDANLAEDLTQDAFRAAWERLAQFNGEASLSSWLHRIAYHKFVDQRRKRSREISHDDRLSDQIPNLQDDSPWRHAASREEIQRLAAAVEQLTEELRVVVYLHYFEGLSMHEAAAILEQPVGTVKWRAQIAVRRLRTLLQVDCLP